MTDGSSKVPQGWLRWRTRPKVSSSEVEVTAQAVYDELVKTAISPGFRKLGLSGSGGRYSMRSDNCWVLVSLQKSAYSDAREVQFTLNLLVANRSAWDSARAQKTYLPERPAAGTKYSAGESQTRIGQLLPDRADKWWRIHQGASPAAVADDLLRDFETIGLPWLLGEMKTLSAHA